MTDSKIDKVSLALKIEKLIENGRKEIKTKKQLEKYPIGSLISHIDKNNIFRHGGFITKFKPDYFIYITPDFKTKYIARYTNIKKMWVGSVYKTKDDVVSLVQSDKPETKFPVKINDIVMYYAADKYNHKRFTYTDKYKRAIKWVEYFEQ